MQVTGVGSLFHTHFAKEDVRNSNAVMNADIEKPKTTLEKLSEFSSANYFFSSFKV